LTLTISGNIYMACILRDAGHVRSWADAFLIAKGIDQGVVTGYRNERDALVIRR